MEEGHLCLQDAVPDNRIVGVTGHEQHLDARSRCRQPFGQNSTAHLRHDDIGNQQVDRPRLVFGNSNGLAAVTGLQHGVTRGFKSTSDKLPYGGFVFDQKNGFGAFERLADSRLRLPRDTQPLDLRQVHLEGGSVSGLAVHGDVTTALIDDAVDDGQTQACAFADLFRGEEWLENARLGFFVHARARVTDGQQDVAPRPDLRVALCIRLVEIDRRRLDGQLAALRHGVTGVHRQVHDDLFDLARIDFHMPKVRVENGFQVHVLPDQAPEHVLGAPDNAVEVQHLDFHHVFTTEGQELASQRSGPLPGLVNCLQRVVRGVARSKVRQEHFAGPRDDGQQIVEIMGDTARQLPDGLHLLRLGELGLAYAQTLFGTFAHDELAELASGRRYHGKQRIVRLPNIVVKEFHDPKQLVSVEDREGKGTAQTAMTRDRGPRKVGLHCYVGHPMGPPVGPDAAQQTHAAAEGGGLAHLHKGGRIGCQCLPDGDEAQ